MQYLHEENKSSVHSFILFILVIRFFMLNLSPVSLYLNILFHV